MIESNAYPLAGNSSAQLFGQSPKRHASFFLSVENKKVGVKTVMLFAPSLPHPALRRGSVCGRDY